MANNDWNNLAEQDRQRPEAEQPSQLNPETGRARWFSWWWIWIVVIVFVFVWLLGWGWGSSSASRDWGGKRQIVVVQPNRSLGPTIRGLAAYPEVHEEINGKQT